MKLKIKLMAGLLIFILACGQKQGGKITVASKTLITETEINILVDKWLKLWETYNLEMLDEIFLQSKELTYFSSEKEGLISGYKEMWPHHAGFGFVEGGKQPEKILWLENMETRIYGSTALVAGIWYFGNKTVVKDSVQNGPVTFVVKIDNQGIPKIVHTHFANY